jgi:hypothetical protein
MGLIDIRCLLILIFLLGGIFYSVYVMAGEYFVHGFKPITPKASGYYLLLSLIHVVYYFINDEHIKPHFPNDLLWVKIIQFMIFILVYGMAILIQWKKYRQGS